MRAFASAVLLAVFGLCLPAAADVADDILATAIERYQAGDMQPALGGINAALRGRLSGSQLAKAYYYRGLANRKLGQPGQAVTDLTRALDYSGLTDTERSDAKQNLQTAYQEAGLSQNEKVVVARSGEEETEPPRKAARQAWAMTPLVTTVTGSIDDATAVAAASKVEPETWETSSTATPKSVPPPSLQRPTSWGKEQVALATLPPIPQPAKTSAAQVPPKSNSDKGVALTPAAAPVLAPFVTQVSASPAPLPAAPEETRLLVGEAHSRNEAFALAVRLTSQRGAELGPRHPQIAEMQYADTSVYRLRLGPFTDQGQAMALCRSLRDSGYDCVSE